MRKSVEAETNLPVNIDNLIAMRYLERRARRSLAGTDDPFEEDEVLEQLDQDSEGYMMGFIMQMWGDKSVKPQPRAPQQTDRPETRRTSEISRKDDGTTDRKRGYKSEKRQDKKRRKVEKERRRRTMHGSETLELAKIETKRYHKKRVEEADRGQEQPATCHQGELYEIHSSSDTGEVGFREQTASPWSRISEYSDSTYDEGIVTKQLFCLMGLDGGSFCITF